MILSRQGIAVACTAAAGLAALGAAACFSERSASPSVQRAAACRVPVSVIDSMHVIVAIRDFAFVPDSIVVPVGATVTWVNCEDAGVEPHTTTSDVIGVWDSSDLIPGARFSRRFPAAGAFPYHCTPHQGLGMVGQIVVQ